LLTHENTVKLKLTFFGFFLLLSTRKKENWKYGRWKFEFFQSGIRSFNFYACQYCYKQS
jgi:hypothetical protein